MEKKVLEVGMKDSMVKVVTSEDVVKFSEVSGDINPVHLDEEFAKTTMFTALMSEMPDFDFTCPVVFEGAPIYLASEDRYQVKFRYFCADSTGRTWPKDYTIKIKLTSDQSPQIKWTDRIENPLGLRVQEYTVVEGDGDPLNTGFLATE